MLRVRPWKRLMGAPSVGVVAGAITEADLVRQCGLQAFIVASDKPELLARLGQPLQKCWRESTGPHYLETRRATQQERRVTGTHRSRAGVQPRVQVC